MDEIEEQKRGIRYQKMFLPTVGYALLYTIFLYDNFSSITMPLFVITTIAYVFYSMKQLQVVNKKISYFYMGIMFLLALSDATTGNYMILFFNNLGIILLLVCLLLHNFYEDKRWSLGKYLCAVLRSIVGAVGCIAEPFKDVSCYRKQKNKEEESKVIYVLFGICIAVPFLLLVTALLYSADAVFANIIRKNFQYNFHMGKIVGVVSMFLFAFFSAYCGIVFMEKRKIAEECVERKILEPIIAITVLGMTSVVYVFFSGIQIIYLFLRKMSLPNGYSYAQYAREGFFQLLFVCFINVSLVLLVTCYFKDHTILKVLQVLISGCTYVMIASSAYRMIIYIINYNLTFLRILVLWALVLLTALLSGVLTRIFRNNFSLFHYGIVIICIAYVGLAFSHPDYYIASYNLKKMDAQSDYRYLQHLSSDAAPIIARQDGKWVESYAKRIYRNNSQGIRSYNFSRARAVNILSKAGKIQDYKQE